jgi:hypothetical protein
MSRSTLSGCLLSFMYVEFAGANARNLFLPSGSLLPISTVMPSRISSICSFINACDRMSARLEARSFACRSALEVDPMKDEVWGSFAAIARPVGTAATRQRQSINERGRGRTPACSSLRPCHRLL